MAFSPSILRSPRMAFSVWFFSPKYLRCSSGRSVLHARLVLDNKRTSSSVLSARISVSGSACPPLQPHAPKGPLEFGGAASCVLNLHSEAARCKTLVSASVTGWTGLGKPVAWTLQKATFPCFYNPKKNKGEMITATANKIREAPEFALDPGVRTIRVSRKCRGGTSTLAPP
jgi:hypothetical protein